LLPSLFWAFTAATLIILATFGERPERGFAVLIVVAVGATWLNFERDGWTDPVALLAIDGVVLAAGLLLALRTDRYWPLWFSGFQMLTVLTGIAHLVSPDHVPALFLNLSALWFYPALWCSTAGVVFDSRARRRLSPAGPAPADPARTGPAGAAD
jgi:hypothetical protein